MPNYNYRSNDCMRRTQYQRTVPVPHTKTVCEYNTCIEEPSTDNCVHDALKEFPIAMAYVPWQNFKALYPVEKALCKGTIFEELDKPFLGIGGCCK